VERVSVEVLAKRARRLEGLWSKDEGKRTARFGPFRMSAFDPKRTLAT
jgi:hypothetical protein